MEPSIDPVRLSRRKLRCSTCDERRDTYSLRKAVLIQNSIVTAKSIPSLPSEEDQPPCHEAQAAVDDDEDGLGFIFPDMSSWGSHDDDSDEEDLDESDWLDAVLSDLDDDPIVSVREDGEEDEEDYYVPSRPDTSVKSTSPSPSPSPPPPHSEPIYISSPQQHPLYNRRPLPVAPPLLFDLPFFDDSSDFSDDSEPSTPSTPSLLSDREVDMVRISTSPESDDLSSSPPSPVDSKNVSYNPREDYFSCHYFRAYDAF